MSARYFPSSSSSQASESTLRPSSHSPRVSEFRASQVPSTVLRSSSSYISPYAPLPKQPEQLPIVSVLRTQNLPSPRQSVSVAGSLVGPSELAHRTRPAAPPTHLSSAQDNTLYRGISPSRSPSISSASMNSSKKISQADKATLIQSLRTHRVNTLIELRRIEKIFASLDTPDVTEPMTNAWAYYVNSNNLISELRGLTKSYPFSSECLDEAKWMVIGDPHSQRSWNYCWLVLQKVRNQNLIPKHARLLAMKPAMWGGRTPTAAGVEQLTSACVTEWTRALSQLLRHWDSPPTTTGK